MMNLLEVVDLLRLAVRVLGEKKVRSILTIIGIAIGPTALVAILGVVEGYSNYVISQVQGLGQDFIIIMPGSSYALTSDDLKFLKKLPEVKYVTPFYSTRVKVKQGGRYIDASLYAVDLEVFFKALKKLRIEEGNIPPPSDVVGAVIGKFIAFDDKGNRYYHVGDIVTLKYYSIKEGRMKTKNVNVVVRGILGEFGNAFFVNPDTTVFVPFEAGRRLFGFSKWTGVIVIVRDPAYVEPLTRKLREIYGERAAIISLIEISRVISSITSAMRLVTVAAGSAAFIVAITGIAASMITSVMERTREIGVLKAIGFTNIEIITSILFESLVMSALGGLIGIGLGSVGAYVLSQRGFVIQGAETVVIKAPPAISISLIAEALAVTIAVGVLGGLLPAYQASRIPPAVALRYE
ncbi:ABC transporter permease [Pyrofollis japonicus]|nr:ABC transporter permease [Pyrofollis japonicus]